MKIRKKCTTCKEWLPLRYFCKWHKGKDGLSFRCKRCAKRLADEYRREVKAISPEPTGVYTCSRCHITKPVKEFGRDRYRLVGVKSACKACISAQLTDRKVRVLTFYSHKKYPICKCCGICDIRFLTIDHINNDGSKHRRQHGGNVYFDLDKNKPEGLQVLCHNCNSVRFHYGECGGH